MEELNPLYLLLLPLAMLVFLWLRRNKQPDNPWLGTGSFCAAVCSALSGVLVALREFGVEEMMRSGRSSFAQNLSLAGMVMLVVFAVVCGVALVTVLRLSSAPQRAWLIACWPCGSCLGRSHDALQSRAGRQSLSSSRSSSRPPT